MFHVLFRTINLIKVNVLVGVFKQNYIVLYTHTPNATSAIIMINVVISLIIYNSL
jgi:hypothetical protein